MQLDVGQKFDRYQVSSHLGNGISGQSYEAYDTLLQRTVVLKLIHPWTPLSDAIRRQFFRELQNMSILNHPIIASILDYGDIDGQLYLARKYTSPGSLLGTQGRSWFTPPLPLEQAIRYTTQIAQGLHYLHVRGFLHGALTLSNILAQHNPTQLGASNAPLLVSDAGTAHFVRRYGHPFITLLPITSAPEQFHKRTVPASDQYALATILYYWLAGRPPFLGPPDEIEQQKQQGIEISPSTFTTPITPELAQIMQQALSPSIEERYSSLQTFWEELQQANQPSLYAETNPSLPDLNQTQNGHISKESGPGHIGISLSEAFSTLHTYSVPHISQTNKTTTGSHNTGGLEKLLNTILSTNSTEEIPSPGKPDAEKHSHPVQPEKEPQPEPTPDPVQPEPTPTPQQVPHPDVPQPLPDPMPIPTPTPEIIPERAPEPPNKSLPEIIPPAPDIAEPLHSSNQAAKHSTMLVITSQYVGEPYEVVIDREEMTIGRAGSSDILLDFDPFTSRHHALLQKQNGQYFLYDRRSAYGTSVNGQALTSDQGRLLQDGDQISIGQYTLLFSIGTTQESHDRASQNAQV